MEPVLVTHYHEIALKGGNRERFERQLIANMQRACETIPGVRVMRMYGRVLVRLAQGSDHPRVAERLTRVFGIANAGLGYETRCTLPELTEDAITLVRGYLAAHPSASFAVRVQRSDKTYPGTSMELERAIGGAIQDATGLRVDLDAPELTVRVELVDGHAFVLVARVAGPGGLPVGISGRVAVLLSSGFDSPVAAWRILKRGCTAVLVHFHSYPYTSDASIRNVRAIAERLAVWQGTTTLVTVPLIEYQKAIMMRAPHEVRVLLYRRAMVHIAERIAREEGASALVTGENLGQVASQTLPNIAAVEAAATLPILRPLIGYDKLEIIAEAERIGTAEISRQPYDDCCSLFTPAHPATAATDSALQAIEDGLALDDHLDRAWAARERTEISTPPESTT